MGPRLHLVETHDVDIAAARRCRGLGAPDAGIIVASVPPNLRPSQTSRYVDAVLRGIGMRPDVQQRKRNACRDRAAAEAWLTALFPSDLVVVDAQWLPPVHTTDLMALATTVGIDRVWFVCHGEPAALPDALYQAAESASLDDVLALAAPPTHTAAEAPAGLPAGLWLPTADFTTFLADCHRFLPDPVATIVDEAYRRQLRRAIERLTNDVAEPAIEDALIGVADTVVTEADVVVGLRAVQAAAFRAGWHVRANLHQSVPELFILAGAARRTPADWARARSYRDPWRAAVLALAALRLGPADMERLRISDVASDGARVRHCGTWLATEPGSEHLLAALVAVRRLAGGTDDDFLVGQDHPVSAHTISCQLRAAAGEVGLHVVGATVDWAAPTPDQRARRLGVTIRRLGDPATHLPGPPDRVAQSDEDHGIPTAAQARAAVTGLRVRQRRHELGTTLNAAAASSGISAPLLRRIEGGDTAAAGRCTLDQLVRLAAALDVHLTELLEPPERGRPGVAHGDAATLGALLHGARTMVTTEDVCTALAWRSDRFDAALEALDAQLRPAGLRVHRLHDQVGISSDAPAVPSQALTHVVRSTIAARDLTISEARVLHRLMTGQNVDQLPTREANALGVLRKAGIVTTCEPASVSDATLESIGAAP